MNPLSRCYLSAEQEIHNLIVTEANESTSLAFRVLAHPRLG